MGGDELTHAGSRSGEPQTDALAVSVIVPVFNNAGPLRECLRALEAQTLPRHTYEIIVVDNGSTDGSSAVAAGCPGARLTHEPAPSSYAARNRGVSVARGRILAFTDSDCIPAADWLAHGVAEVERDPARIIAAGHIDVFYADPAAPSAVELYEGVTALDQRRFVERGGFGATANLFVARSVFDRVGPFNARLKSSGDVEWCQRAASRGCTLRYASQARVSHPARRTLRDLHLKVTRTIGGAHDLKGGARLMGIDRPLIADWVPPIRYAWTALRDPAVPRLRDRIRVAGVMFFVRYAEAIERLRLRLGGTSRR